MHLRFIDTGMNNLNNYLTLTNNIHNQHKRYLHILYLPDSENLKTTILFLK